MKNLVLKIIRGSYPPVSPRYSYDLRGLVGQLFRRNPRDRPSVNTILRQSFIRRHTEKFLTPEQHDEEFSHTVLHRNKKPSRPTSAAVAYKKPDPKPWPSAKSPAEGRAKQIAGIYCQSVAVKKPSAAPRYQRYAEQRKRNDGDAERRNRLLEAERKRKEMEKKRKDELALLRIQREDRIRVEHIKRARDNARHINLKRSADLFEPKKQENKSDENKNPFDNKVDIPAKVPRPTSAPSRPQPQRYEKYHQYLNKLREGDRAGAAEVVAPKLAQVKEAWNDRVSAQNAVMEAIGNKVEGKMAADRARVANEYWQRRQEALDNRRQGQIIVHGEKMGEGVGGALKPYNIDPEPQQHGRNKEESEYLARLRQIRIQNFNERRAIRERCRGNHYQVVNAEQEAAKLRREKEEALQKQAEERAELVRQNVEMRKKALDRQVLKKADEGKNGQDEIARRIVPADIRPVKYVPNPIGITQALNAVGVNREEPEPTEIKDEEKEIPASQPAPNIIAKPEVRKNILKRLNEKFMANVTDDEETKKHDEKPAVRETIGEKDAHSKVQPQWAAGDIGQRLAALPLEETASQMEATTYDDDVIMNKAKDVVAKRGWNLPSNTVVNKLNLLSICDPTLTSALNEDDEDDLHSKNEGDECSNSENTNNNNTKCTAIQSDMQTQLVQIGARPLPAVPARPRSPVKFTLNLDQQKRQKPPSYLAYLKEAKRISPQPANKGTVVLGDMSAATLRDTPEVELSETAGKPATKQPTVAALAAKFNSGNFHSDRKGTFVVPQKSQQKVPEALSPPGGVNEVKDEMEGQSRELIVGVVEKDDLSDNDILEIKLEDKNTLVTSKATGPTQQAWASNSGGEKSPVKPQNQEKPPPLKHASEEMMHSSSEPQKSPRPTPPTSMASPKISSDRPLFAKIPHTPGTPSSLPISGQAVSPPSAQKLNKTMYATANEEMILKMTLGHFDSPNPKLLRTCSMPDLTKAIPEEVDSSTSKEASPLRRSSEQIQIDSVESSHTSSPSSPPLPDATNLAASIAGSMNDTNFDDGELIPSSSQEDAGSLEEEDEDMANLRANLENALLKDDDPEFSSDVEQDADNKTEEDEAWESDDASSVASSNDGTDDVSDTESVFSRLEANREELEAELGFEEFMRAYKYVQAIHEDEEEEIKDGERRIRAILGQKHDRLYPRILQLVMADGAYCEDNN